VSLANDLVKHAALYAPASVDALLVQPFMGDAKRTVKDRIDEVVGLIRENMKPVRLTVV
jgi:hypothetical protein